MEQLLCPKCRTEIKSNSDFCNKCGLDLIKINELIRDGDNFLNQEKYQDAISCYEKAIKIGKNNDLAWYGKAKALLKQGENSENVTLCVKCQLCPVLSEAFYEDAIKCYENAIRINPKFKDAWRGKEMALEKLGRPEDARKCFENSK